MFQEVGLETLYGDNTTASFDIVAVHGLNGDRIRSWTSKSGGCWLNDWLGASFPSLRVMTYGYRSDNNSSLRVIADSLITDLCAQRENVSSRPIIFIGHNVGGNIIKQALLLSRVHPVSYKREIYENTAGIFFFGTRHVGKYLTNTLMWSIFTLARVVTNVVRLPNSAHLFEDADIENSNRQFRSLGSRYKIACCFETLPVFSNVILVPEKAATLQGFDKIPIDANHNGMTKFARQTDNGYVRVAAELRQMMLEITEQRTVQEIGRNVDGNRTHQLSQEQGRTAHQDGLGLLCLDGGGVRGLSSLLVLKDLMFAIQRNLKLKDLPKPCDYFDLICGTSTGGLRKADSYNAGPTAYEKLSREIFELKTWSMWAQGAWNWSRGNGWFSASALEAAIVEILEYRLPIAEARELGDLIGEVELRDSLPDGCKVFVCAVDVDTHDCIRLRSYERGGGLPVPEFFDCTLIEAARATSAAPTYFPTAQIRATTFFDGAMKNNNPILELVKEVREDGALRNRRVGCLVSIGTGKSQHSPYQPGLIGLAKTLARLATDTEAKHNEIMTDVAYDDLRDRYFRLNVEAGLGDIDLSGWNMLPKIKAITLDFLQEHDTIAQIEKCAQLMSSLNRLSLPVDTVETPA